MYYQPIDEMSLRHLFSSKEAEEILKMSYLGPVLNPSGGIETSPDCLILDKRGDKYKILRGEFKFIPTSKKDFETNGKFDLAVIWSISPPLTMQKLEEELVKQNDCKEIIVLSEYKILYGLPKYYPDIGVITRKEEEEMKKAMERVKHIATLYCAYIAAKIYPDMFHQDKMLDYLSTKFLDIKKMTGIKRERQVFGSLILGRPQLIEKILYKLYCWTNNIDANIALRELGKKIQIQFKGDIPGPDIIDSIKKNP